MRLVPFLILFLSIHDAAAGQADRQRPRVLVLSDIENEPDDAESFVRFLVYSNNWDVEDPSGSPSGAGPTASRRHYNGLRTASADPLSTGDPDGFS